MVKDSTNLPPKETLENVNHELDIIDRVPASRKKRFPPPKPKLRAKSGITDTDEKDYTIIKRVQSINRSASRGPPRSRSISRQELPNKSRVGDTKSKELLGILSKVVRSSSRQRKESRSPLPFLSRGRSSSRQRADSGDETSGPRRSTSKVAKVLKKMRSFSRRRKKVTSDVETSDTDRSRRSERRFDESRGRIRELRSVERKLNTDEGLNSKHSQNEVFETPEKVSDDEETPQEVQNSHAVQPNDEEQNSPESVERHTSDRYKIEVESASESEVEAESESEEIDSQKSKSEDDPDALNEDDVMQLDPENSRMHVACLLHYPSKNIIDELERNNALASKKNSAGDLPLHYALMDKRSVNLTVLTTLLTLYPDAVQKPNAYRSLPIHSACLVGAPSTEAIRSVLSLCPDSVMVRSKFPIPFEQDMLDNVVQDSSSSEEEEEEAQNNKKDTMNNFLDLIGYGEKAPPPKKPKKKKKGCVDDNLTQGKQMYETGWTPLHLAVINGANSDVIALLIKANPQCVFVKSNRGRMAIDCAQYMVRQHWLYGTDDEATVRKTFHAIELLEEAAIDNQ